LGKKRGRERNCHKLLLGKNLKPKMLSGPVYSCLAKGQGQVFSPVPTEHWATKVHRLFHTCVPNRSNFSWG